MSDLYVLEHFNSEFEEYPDYFQPWFEQSYMFAKQMLKDWSDHDIAIELESIDRCISGGTPWELPLYFSTKEPLFQPIDGMFGTPTGRAGYAILSNAVQKNVHIDTIIFR